MGYPVNFKGENWKAYQPTYFKDLVWYEGSNGGYVTRTHCCCHFSGWHSWEDLYCDCPPHGFAKLSKTPPPPLLEKYLVLTCIILQLETTTSTPTKGQIWEKSQEDDMSKGNHNWALKTKALKQEAEPASSRFLSQTNIKRILFSRRRCTCTLLFPLFLTLASWG